MSGRWLHRHPLAGFLTLAFGISSGGIFVILAARSFDLSPMLPLEGGAMLLVMLLGPSVSGLLLTGLLGGKAGIGRLADALAIHGVTGGNQSRIHELLNATAGAEKGRPDAKSDHIPARGEGLPVTPGIRCGPAASARR